MRKARINAPLGYRCAPSGATVVAFPEGTEVEGRVAEWAVADGAAVWVNDPREEAKVETVPEVKKKRGRPRKKPE